MATVTIQKIEPFQASQTHVITGKVTGALYTVNALGQVIVDTRDSPYLLAKGWTVIL